MESKQRVWESLRSDVRQADSLIEQQLNDLETASRLEDGAGSREAVHGDEARAAAARLLSAQGQFNRQRAEVDASLQRFEMLLDTMAETARALPPESAAQRHTERFQELAAEKRRALLRITADFRRRREWAELLPSVTNDLETFRENAGVRILMEEQDSLRHTQRRIEGILDQADASRDQMLAQRERFGHVEDRLVQIAQRVPLIKNVLARIDAKRRRDTVILGGVIGICLFVTVLFI